MFEKILVPVDLSDKNRTALHHARELAAQGEGGITLLHVIETIDDASFDELGDFYDRLEQRASRNLEELAEETRKGGIPAHQRVVYGKRVREIVRFAEEDHTDLIVLGSHPVNPQRPRDSWITISYQVAILAGCPVLLVK
jgi:nucleotide-binding universal stress UspA family protein